MHFKPLFYAFNTDSVSSSHLPTDPDSQRAITRLNDAQTRPHPLRKRVRNNPPLVLSLTEYSRVPTPEEFNKLCAVKGDLLLKFARGNNVPVVSPEQLHEDATKDPTILWWPIIHDVTNKNMEVGSGAVKQILQRIVRKRNKDAKKLYRGSDTKKENEKLAAAAEETYTRTGRPIANSPTDR